AAHAQQRNVKFVLDWAFQGQQSVFTIPADDGTYAKRNLNVTVDRGAGSGDAVSKVAAGTYDLGLADLYTMMNHNANSPERKLIAVALVHDKSALSVVSMKSANIRKPIDLNGKRIAAPLGDASRQVFPLFAVSNQINPSSIEWITVTPQLRETMLVRGQADAISGHITTIMLNLRGMKIPANDVQPMLYADHGVELYGHAIVAQPQFAEQNPQLITDFLRATVHGLNEMIRDRDLAVKSVQKRDGLLNDELEKARIQMSLDAMFMSPQVVQNGLSNVDKARLARSIDQVAKAFQMKTVPSVDEVYTDRYLPPRAELRVIAK
ncbi:MAG: ABC transporter substrate-binding protein, partial [Burkholderiales bacterium]